MLFRNDYFRFGSTLVLAVLYSGLRETEVSTLVKPLPVIFWCFIVWFSPKRREGYRVLASLCTAFIGDILLDLGEDWLIVATVPFLGSTLILATAFHLRSRSGLRNFHVSKEISLLVIWAIAAIVFYGLTAIRLEMSERLNGAVLLAISVLLLWRSSAVALLSTDPLDHRFRRWIGFAGAFGIVANYLLWAIDLGGTDIPRDLVIQVYYWGQASAAWSFLQRQTRQSD
jgi:hypothetical protein